MAERINLFKLYKRGKTYYASFNIPRKDKPAIRGRYSCFTDDRKEAELYCQEKIHKLINATPDIARLSIAEAFSLFYQNYSTTYSRPKELLNRLGNLARDLDAKYLDEVDIPCVNKYIVFRLKSVKNATINRELALLSSIITKISLLGYKTADVKPLKYKLKTPAENVRFLPDWEIAQKIIDNAPPHLKPIIYTALYTGLRRGNLLALKWENIDFKNNQITVKVKDKTTQGGKTLTIPMISKLKEILQNIDRVSDYVFTYKGERILDIKKAWHTALKKADIPYFNFHTLRHTTATWLLLQTGNIKLTQQILGHADIKTTTKYAHVLDKQKCVALENCFNSMG